MFRAMCAIAVAGLSCSALCAHSILGAWCLEEEGLVIHFRTKDSLMVMSTADETVNGGGAYTLADSTIFATVVNGELTIKLGYIYRWLNDSLIAARPKFFIVNDDTAQQVTRQMTMRRCKAPADGPAKNPLPVKDSRQK